MEAHDMTPKKSLFAIVCLTAAVEGKTGIDALMSNEPASSKPPMPLPPNDVSRDMLDVLFSAHSLPIFNR